MEQERENDVVESAAQILSGVIMKVSEFEEGRISQFHSVQLETQGSPAKNGHSANEVLKYTVIQFALQYVLCYHSL
jgi:hypothetical protein